MRLTKHTAYALRILTHLASSGERPVPVPEIAAALHVTEANAMKTARALIDGGFLASTRGRSGGVRLAREAGDISVGAVVRALEPTRVEADCVGFEVDCALRSRTPLNRLLDDAMERFCATLDPHTVADLVGQRPDVRGSGPDAAPDAAVEIVAGRA